MKLRALAPLALLAAASAHGAVTLTFGTPAGLPLTALAAPAIGASTTVSVFYTSTTALSDNELFVAFDRSISQGPTATKLDGKLALSSPVAAGGVSLFGVGLAGGFGPGGPARPYGLDVLDVSATAGLLPATATPAKLVDLTLTNLALGPGGSYALSFFVASAPIYATQFYDAAANPVAVVGTPLLVSAAPVPEPAPLAALGLGALALLRRRRS